MRFEFVIFHNCRSAFFVHLFSRAWYQLHVVPRLAYTGYIFSRVWHQLHISVPALVLVTYFPAFGNGESFPAMVWVVRFVFPEFAF